MIETDAKELKSKVQYINKLNNKINQYLQKSETDFTP